MDTNRHRIRNDLKTGTQMDAYHSGLQNGPKIIAVPTIGCFLALCTTYTTPTYYLGPVAYLPTRPLLCIIPIRDNNNAKDCIP